MHEIKQRAKRRLKYRHESESISRSAEWKSRSKGRKSSFFLSPFLLYTWVKERAEIKSYKGEREISVCNQWKNRTTQEVPLVIICSCSIRCWSCCLLLLPSKVGLKLDISSLVLVLSLMKVPSAKPPIRDCSLSQKPEILKVTIDSYSVGPFTLFDHPEREMWAFCHAFWGWPTEVNRLSSWKSSTIFLFLLYPFVLMPRCRKRPGSWHHVRL